eukprot:gene21599-27637_t
MGGRGRGRGGGRGGRGQGDEQQHNATDTAPVPTNDWTRNPSKGGLWDGGEGPAGALDLADFAAAALKFRSEMADMKFTDEGGSVPEDMMERLLREQTFAANGEDEEEDDDAMPDWAADGDDSLSTSNATPKTGFGFSSEQPAAKRNLLLETLNVKSVAATSTIGASIAKPVVVENSQISSNGKGGYGQSAEQQHQLHSSRLQTAVPAPPPPPVEPEWFYTDPQQQVQGPFSQENMKLWHEAGYFSKDLPIKLRQWGGFHAFYLVFPDMAHAFKSVPLEVRTNFPSMPALSSVHSLEHLQALEQQRLQEQQKQQEQQRHQQYLREQQLFEQRQAEESHRQQQQIEQQQLQKQRLFEQQAATDAAARKARDVSGPPPLTPVTLDNRLLSQHKAVPAPSATSAPPPLDSLRKIRISSNLEELNVNKTAAASVVSSESVSKKSVASSGPPPLSQERSREVVVTAAPWAASTPSGGKSAGNSKDSLVAIQNVEKERALERAREAELKQSKANSKNWTSGTPSKPQSASSLSEIQEEESKQREQQRALNESRQPAAAPLTMSSQLKSLLGVRPSGNTAATSASPSAPKQWAASSKPVAETVQSSAPAPSLRDIMQQEEKQVAPSDRGPAVSAGGGGRKQPLSWAAKASTGVNATNLLPVPSAVREPATAQQQQPINKAPAKAVAPVATKQRSDISVGADFGGKGMSREMAEWCAVQLRKITSSVDDHSALMEFCTSLDSASEIREYLSQYLGSSAQLTNFATDFIKYKEGGKKAVLLSGDSQSSSGANNDSRTAAKSGQQQGFTSATSIKKKKPVVAAAATK